MDSILLFLLTVQSIQLFVPIRLLSRLLNKVSDCVTSQHFFTVKNLIEVFLEFLSAFLDVLGTIVCDSKYFFLGERRSI